MLTGVNRLKTTGRPGSLIENAKSPTSTGAVASSKGARGGGLSLTNDGQFKLCHCDVMNLGRFVALCCAKTLHSTVVSENIQVNVVDFCY